MIWVILVVLVFFGLIAFNQSFRYQMSDYFERFIQTRISILLFFIFVALFIVNYQLREGIFLFETWTMFPSQLVFIGLAYLSLMGFWMSFQLGITKLLLAIQGFLLPVFGFLSLIIIVVFGSTHFSFYETNQATLVIQQRFSWLDGSQQIIYLQENWYYARQIGYFTEKLNCTYTYRIEGTTLYYKEIPPGVDEAIIAEEAIHFSN